MGGVYTTPDRQTVTHSKSVEKFQE